MAEPLAKRPKIIRGEDDYMPGNITEIELHNFMTFNHLKCKPGSRLNLVIGPNGSGKSSLVCAIALGLGGEPQLLGRATSIGAYVKRGEESGYIKITLRGATKEEKITIMRKIDTHNKSEWLFNGKAVPKKEIAEITKSFNIQVGNLTQFLPQDRVCEFAKLTPVQLLEETEKAVGDPQLSISHRALVEISKELKNLERAVETNEKTLDQHKAHIAVQQREVERVRQREELGEKAKTMEKKLPWLKYDMKKAEYMEAKEKEKDAKSKFDEAAQILNDLKEPIGRQKQEKAKLDAKVKEVQKRINDNARKRTDVMEKAEHLGVLVQGKYKEMEDLNRQEESRKIRISKAKEDLAAAVLDLENLPPYEPPKSEMERLRNEILEQEVSVRRNRDLKSEKENDLVQKKVALRQCTDRLRDMESRNTKLLQALKSSGATRIFEAYNWVQAHRDEFNKEVYGPVLLEVNVTDRLHANYLEGHVPYYIWKSFITQDPRDRDLLVRNFKALNFDVPVLNYFGSEDSYRAPYQISQQMRELGISSRLDQVFDASFAVKEVLTGQCGLERSYIGSKETDLKADQVLKLGIFDCWTPENHYRWSKSRYGGHVSGSVEVVKQSRLLLSGSDVGEIERLRSRIADLEQSISSLEENVKSLQIEQRHIEDKSAELRKQQEEITEVSRREKHKRREKENRINQMKRKLEALEKEDDLDTTLAKLIDQAEEFNIQRFHCSMEFKKLLVEAVLLKQNLAERQMASFEFEAKIRELELRLKEHEKSALQATMHFENCKNVVQNYREQLQNAKRLAESIAVITPELEKEFLEMPSTIEELEAAIQDCRSQADSILCLNRNVIEEYEYRLRQIEAISTKLEADREKLRRHKAEIDELKESWLVTLRRLVAKINDTFSRNFQEMAVAGEVSLDEHELDFNQFGILIKVKFREEGELQVLSAHHQSGGERSVSTILYLVSLQDLTHCPFRVVDEINQGMDPINERKMFQQLVRAASQPNTPQCFLLTPKLLPDLEYSEACSILNIVNGPWIGQPSKVWSGGDCWRSVAGLVGETRS
ncbi:structural maintenance of chromosomes protein 5 [Morus notabilis]|uniref:structural maintenance of chromosomes protein 5 n=1 Tax=Morus notabilis TaxID=981085 RepID=UPI000CECF9D7|nr:structural maintenance of chromosomes protein 5 [Morus notabilis]